MFLSNEAINLAIPSTSSSSTYPGTRRVLAMRKGGSGRFLIYLARKAKFSNTLSLAFVPVRAKYTSSVQAFISIFIHPPLIRESSAISSSFPLDILPFVSQQIRRIFPSLSLKANSEDFKANSSWGVGSPPKKQMQDTLSVISSTSSSMLLFLSSVL